MAGFLSRYGVTVDRDRMAAMHKNYMETAPSKDMIIAGVEETLEVAAAAGAIGALEQRYGETKTTLFMTDMTDASGKVVTEKNAAGDDVNVKKSGTGIPMSAAGAVVGLTVAALVPMTPGWRRRVLNVATGLGAAWSYRKGIEMGQKWKDSANKVPESSRTATPEPPFMQNAAQAAAAVKGEMSEGGSVVTLVEEANRLLAQKRAAAR